MVVLTDCDVKSKTDFDKTYDASPVPNLVGEHGMGLPKKLNSQSSEEKNEGQPQFGPPVHLKLAEHEHGQDYHRKIHKRIGGLDTSQKCTGIYAMPSGQWVPVFAYWGALKQ